MWFYVLEIGRFSCYDGNNKNIVRHSPRYQVRSSMLNVPKRSSLSSPETCPVSLNGNGTRERRNVSIVKVPFFFLINQKRFRLAFRTNTTVSTGNLHTLERRMSYAHNLQMYNLKHGWRFFYNYNYNNGIKKLRTYRPQSLQIVCINKRVLPLT